MDISANQASVEKDRPSNRFLRLAKSSLQIKKRFRRHASSTEMTAKRQLRFDDTLSLSDRQDHERVDRLLPIMKKFAKILHVTKSATSLDRERDNKMKKANSTKQQLQTQQRQQEEQPESYVSYEDDLKADIDLFFVNEADMDMDL